MPTKARRDDADRAFADALLHAITRGRTPCRTAQLSPHTWSLLEAIAHRHPDTTPAMIVDAFDSPQRHGDSVDYQLTIC